MLCKYCTTNFYLHSDNVAMKINKYGDCPKCGAQYSVDYDIKTKQKITGTELWRDADGNIERK